MKRIAVQVLATLFILVMVMGCADEKGPAELAMKAAQQAVETTKAEAAKLVPEQVAALEAAMASAKDKLAKEMTEGMPQMVEAIQSKVDSLSKLKKLPKNITAEKLAEAKSGLEAVKADLAKAQESFKSGNIAEAVAAAAAVKEKAAKAMESLGIAAPEPAKS